MLGLVLNVNEEHLAPDSPWRTREEVRHHAPLFWLDDGFPVFEVWFWSKEHARWFVMSRRYDAQLAALGVVFFDSIEQLRAALGRRRACG